MAESIKADSASAYLMACTLWQRTWFFIPSLHFIDARSTKGYTNQQIADLTFTSKRTVESHRQSLLEKKGSENTATLIRYAATRLLLTLLNFSGYLQLL